MSSSIVTSAEGARWIERLVLGLIIAILSFTLTNEIKRREEIERQLADVRVALARTATVIEATSEKIDAVASAVEYHRRYHEGGEKGGTR